MQFFHKNKSQTLLPSPFESGEKDSKNKHSQSTATQRGAVARFPLSQANRHSALNPLDPSPQQLHPTFEEQEQQRQQQQYGNTYVHPAHAVTPSHSPQQFTDSGAQTSRSLNDKPTLNLIPTISPASGLNDSDQSNPTSAVYPPQSTETSPQTDSHPRKFRRSIFGLHSSSKDKEKDKDKDKEKGHSHRHSKVLGRSISVRNKPNPAPWPRKYQPDSPPDVTPDHEIAQVEHRIPQNSIKVAQPVQPSLPLSSGTNRSSATIDSEGFNPPRLQRISTEPTTQDSHRQQHSHSDAQQVNQYQESLQHPQFQIDQPYPQRGPGDLQAGGLHNSRDQVPGTPNYSPKLDIHFAPRPPSQQSFGPPSPLHPHSQALESNQQSSQSRQSLLPPTAFMAAQAGTDRHLGTRQTSVPVPSHAQGREVPAGSQPLPSQPSNLSQGSSFKGNMSQQDADQGRETPPPPPPPAKGRDEPAEMDVRALLQKHEELQTKYIKVKKYYFEKEAQVQQLQNTIAHQRMAVSRTVLDDSEYTTRFGRLDGAINNLSFNIRKEWKTIPPWLQGVVNDDAHTVGTKEMTAVGRACLTRWLVDEIFNRIFHPGLEPNLSRQLKLIERNVRRMGRAVTETDKEGQLAKLSAWRRTTLDGLAEVLQSKLAEDHRAHITKILVEKLTANLEANLRSPPPPGLENGVAMIVELAIGIAANIPLESREVTVEYFLPGAPVSESHMKLETTLPPLTNPGIESRVISEPSSAAADRPELGSVKGGELANQSEGEGERDKDVSSSSTIGSGHLNSQFAPKEARKKSVFGSFINKKPHPAQPEPGRPNSALLRELKDREEGEKEPENSIRFAAFVAVEVRSKSAGNVIVKAPVYGHS